MTSWACDACLFISPQIARKKKRRQNCRRLNMRLKLKTLQRGWHRS